MQLSSEDVKKIAHLARLDLTDAEIATYGEQISGILDYIDQLKEVDVTGIEPTAQVGGLTNVVREDQAQPWPADERAAALGQAPAKEDGFIKVKRVIQ
jgi:aspartyl-tRNA(Asn)/glutamyl-tRNA(Gln) amidotransferase subunit C